MTLDNLVQDLRHGVRRLLRAPGFTIVTLLTLALGIGANTAIFSLVNSVILRPLGYPKPGQLMYLTTQFPAFGFDQFWVSPPEYMEFRELNTSFSAVGAFTTAEVNLTAGDRPLRVRSAQVNDDLLRALDVQAEAGRLFNKGETDVSGPPPAPGQPPLIPPRVAILSHELWQTAFGGQPIVGQTVEVNGRRLDVIGIMPAGTDVMDNRTEIWLPLGLNPGNRQNRGNHYLYLIGRLKDGVSETEAKSELTSLIRNWGERVGAKGHIFSLPLQDEAARKQNAGAGHILQMKPMQLEIVGGASRAIWVLQAAVGFVLLIACANLANLLLARAETRRREFAIRTALGAGRGRLLGEFLTEGILLSVMGGALGLVLARAGVQALIRVYPNSLPRTSEVSVDPIVLLFTLGVSIATGLVFGLAPLIHSGAQSLVVALKEGATKGATGAHHNIRRALVMVEVALAVMLVIGAGLLVRTVYNLTVVDAGFERSRLVTFSMTLAEPYDPDTRAPAYERLLDKLRVAPGVLGAAVMSGLPPNRSPEAIPTRIENYTASDSSAVEIVDYYQFVMGDYFETMGVPIVAGRSFEPADAASPGRVVIVNETLANRVWKGRNPIGQRVRPNLSAAIGFGDDSWHTVIGVAKDVKQGGVEKKTGTELYVSLDQLAMAAPTMTVVLRTILPPAALSRTLERLVREVDPAVPIVRLRDMESVFAESIRRPRLLAQLLGAFAGLALLLAGVGTYGVLSYVATERRREIGIRIARGADRSSVLALVVKQGLQLTIIGIVVGLAGALGLNRLIASVLFGVQPTDPTTLAAVIMTITLVAAGACWLPAWRASRLDPNVVLKAD